MKTTKKNLLAISCLLLMGTSSLVLADHENPCENMADAECTVGANGQIIITGDGSEGGMAYPVNPCENITDAECTVGPDGQAIITGDGSEGSIVHVDSKFDRKKEKLANAIDAYKVCVLESETKKDLKQCRKSFRKAKKK